MDSFEGGKFSEIGGKGNPAVSVQAGKVPPESLTRTKEGVV